FADLARKKIWITGGAGYLGTPITQALDAAGADLLCLDLPGKAEALCSRLSLQRTRPEAADLCCPETVDETVQALIGRYGTPDGVLHLAFASSAGKRLE